MKTSPLWIVVALALSTSPLFAQSNDTSGVHVFPVKLDAQITRQTDSNTLEHAIIGKANLIESDRLVLVVDEDAHSLALGRLDSGTNLEFLAQSTTCVIFSTHQFAGNLSFDALSIVQTRITVLGTGDIQIRGRFTTDANGDALQASATLSGVVNDSVNGNVEDADVFLKGTLSPSGHAFNTDDITFPE